MGVYLVALTVGVEDYPPGHRRRWARRIFLSVCLRLNKIATCAKRLGDIAFCIVGTKTARCNDNETREVQAAEAAIKDGRKNES